MRPSAEDRLAEAIMRRFRREAIPLAVKKVCRDCGAVLRTDVDLDTHDLRCPGPIKLVFIDEGDPVAEVGDE